MPEPMMVPTTMAMPSKRFNSFRKPSACVSARSAAHAGAGSPVVVIP